MSDKMRWRYGDTNPVSAAVESSIVIEIGDMVWQDTDNAKPACSGADQESRASNQERFVKRFLGVAMQRSRAGDSDPIRVATTGVFEFECRFSPFELGDLVGPDFEDGQLLNQRTRFVGISTFAIGRVAKRAAAPVTSVLVDIRSTVMTGGV